MPYVPPLANTFASTNVIPLVPNTGQSDAEIVFAGVANLNLGQQNVSGSGTIPPPTIPVSSELQQQQQQQFMSEASPLINVPSQPLISIPAVSESQPPTIPIHSTMHQQQQQHSSIFGTVPPTSIPSLNESFNIPAAINHSSVPASVYQTNPSLSK